MKYLKTVLLFLLISAGLFAQSSEEYFKLGAVAFNQQDYQKAYDNFFASNSIEENADTLYNLGLSAQKLDKMGYARLYYLKAVYKNPRHPEALFALQMLQKKFSDTFIVFYFSTFFDELSNAEWRLIAYIALLFTVAFIALPLIYDNTSGATIFLSFIAISMFSVSLAGVFYWHSFSNIAVSLKNDAMLRHSPAQNAPMSSVLQAGELATIKTARKNFIYVEAQNGKSGWADIEDVCPISSK